jgi:hypothetical protein
LALEEMVSQETQEQKEMTHQLGLRFPYHQRAAVTVVAGMSGVYRVALVDQAVVVKGI